MMLAGDRPGREWRGFAWEERGGLSAGRGARCCRARRLALARRAAPQRIVCRARPVSQSPTSMIETALVASQAGACRVRGVARPRGRLEYRFRALAARTAWSGRYYQLGNGGFAGNIDRPSLEAEAARGNAAAATDTGHRGDGFDARWAAGNPVASMDYGHRSIKATADAAAVLIAAYYGRPARWRYFAGCSNGGRQALMAAQRYPEDWDGMLAGAPANLWTDQFVAFARLQHRLRSVPGAWLPPEQLGVDSARGPRLLPRARPDRRSRDRPAGLPPRYRPARLPRGGGSPCLSPDAGGKPASDRRHRLSADIGGNQ